MAVAIISDSMRTPTTPAELLATLPLPELAGALGVDGETVRKAKYLELLPASWFFAILAVSGQVPPRHLFAFKLSSTYGHVSSGLLGSG
jgi:hypothetical protein